MGRPPTRVVLVGTGTDVGKTHVTACLLALARRRGVRAVGYKPVATGVADRCGDAEIHALASGRVYEPPTFSYARPVSAHVAAREEGRPIDLARVTSKVLELAKGSDAVLVESAGGLFSPVSEADTNVALVARLSPVVVVLVAPDRLGVLHDVTACTLAARAAGVTIHAVALSAPREPDASTGENARELDHLGWGRVAAVFPRAAYDAPGSLDAAGRLWDAIVGTALPVPGGVA